MEYLPWIVIGAIAGFLASQLVSKRGSGLIIDVLLGIVGAVVASWLAQTLRLADVTGLNLYSILITTGGAFGVLILYHGLRPSS